VRSRQVLGALIVAWVAAACSGDDTDTAGEGDTTGAAGAGGADELPAGYADHQSEVDANVAMGNIEALVPTQAEAYASG
jgi:hypothetical protein